jgi:hypothetical protein
MNNVMIKIDGRDALPLRAIPYVTNWQESPDSLVRVLAAPKTKKFRGKNIRIKHSELFAYRADDEGNYAQINHKQWERSVLAIDNLSGNFKANEREGELYGNHDAWRTAAVLILPDNAFIWLDEFQAWYSRTRQPEINSDNLSDAPTDDDVEQQSDMLDFVQCFPAEIESRLWRYSSDFASTAQRQEDELPAPTTHPGTNERDETPATTADWVEAARTVALECIARHKAPDLFPNQVDVCGHVAKILRQTKIFGSQGKPLRSSYIQRNAIQGDWWKANKP